jgi:hypothetical protein
MAFFFILAGVILYVLSRISTKLNFYANEWFYQNLFFRYLIDLTGVGSVLLIIDL